MSDGARETEVRCVYLVQPRGRGVVRGWLLPRLKAAGLRVCIDAESFDIGVPSLVNMERAVADSRYVLLVLTPAWVASEWTEFEGLLTQTADPAAVAGGCCRCYWKLAARRSVSRC